MSMRCLLGQLPTGHDCILAAYPIFCVPLSYKETHMTPAKEHRASRPAQPKASLAMKLREALVFSEADLVGVANETMASMPLVQAETFRRRLSGNKSFQVAIKRTTIDVGVVLALAKSLASDAEFEDSAALLHDVNLAAHDGMVGTYAEAMIKLDLENVKQMAAGSIPNDDALLYRLIPFENVINRLALLGRCLSAIKAQIAAESAHDHATA